MSSGSRSGAWVVRSLVIVAIAIGCGGEREGVPQATEGAAPAAAPAAPSAPSADARAEAEQIFATRCVTCHGPQGAGDGPASAGLTPPPRNFQDPVWQQSVSDAHIEQIVQYGGAAVGRSAAMPGNPDLTGKPEVVAALREHIRALKQ